jgi:predicted outer membrane protein
MRAGARTAVRRACALVAAFALAAGPAAAADERMVEAVGAVPVAGGKSPRSGPRREAAVREAIAEAVCGVAREMLPALEPEAAKQAVDRALAPDPREFANRFRIVEDRGEGPALLVVEPGVTTEYTVVVQAQVDVARVRQRLERAGLLAPPTGEPTRERVRVVLEQVDGFAAYNAVRTLLDELGARGAVPIELERGRAVLEVTSRLGTRELLDALVRSAPPELRIEPLGADADSLTLRAHFLPAAAGTP